MRRSGFFFGLCVLIGSAFSPPAWAQTRVALVVGNSGYRNVSPLDNPANDARLLAETLRGLGFTLVGGGAQLDLDKAAFDRTVQDFGRRLAGADVGLFYYAGHGIQVRGENYLIPIDANPTKEADVDFQMLNSGLVLRQMETAGTRLNIVILDACRNNPFGGRGLAVGRAQDAGNIRVRDTSSGLAQMQAPSGTLISFATQPGNVAQDGVGGNSPYAKALATQMRRQGLDIFQTFNQVGLAVQEATGGPAALGVFVTDQGRLLFRAACGRGGACFCAFRRRGGVEFTQGLDRCGGAAPVRRRVSQRRTPRGGASARSRSRAS
jgi:uncharacterized caspase-like protein